MTDIQQIINDIEKNVHDYGNADGKEFGAVETLKDKNDPSWLPPITDLIFSVSMGIIGCHVSRRIDCDPKSYYYAYDKWGVSKHQISLVVRGLVTLYGEDFELLNTGMAYVIGSNLKGLLPDCLCVRLEGDNWFIFPDVRPEED